MELSVKDTLDVIYKLTLLNNTSKSWNIHDYINAYSMFDKNYRSLSKLTKEYNIETMMLLSIATNRPSTHASALGRELRKGQFHISNPNTNEMCMKFEQLVVLTGTSDRWVKKGLLDAFMLGYGKYDHEKTIKSIMKNIKTVQAMEPRQGVDFIKTKLFKT